MIPSNLQNSSWTKQVTKSLINQTDTVVNGRLLEQLSPEPCCPRGFTGYMGWSSCKRYFQCQRGALIGTIYDVPSGYLYDQNLQSLNWENQVTCIEAKCD